VLFYEATEGGAGVLTRLVHDPDALARVAHQALRTLHLDIPAFGEPLPALEALSDVAGTACVAGCYRCLLSYYNQPDHPVIDRRDLGARRLLLCLAAVRTQLATVGEAASRANGDEASSFDATGAGVPAPDRMNVDLDGVPVIALWRAARVALVAESDPGWSLQSKGLTVISWPDEAGRRVEAMDALRAALGLRA
jgi:hypothetical protein